MTLISNHQLNNEQLTDLDALCAACKQTDGNAIPLYQHLLCQQRTKASNILVYQQQQLVGFLSVYFFYEEACEIALLIHPDHRRQGIALQMLKEVLPLIRAEHITTLIFSASHYRENASLLATNFRYKFSEYAMKRDDNLPLVVENSELVVHLAQDEDLSDLCTIDRSCFPKQVATTSARFHALINDANYSIFVASHQHRLIGKAHIAWQENGARIVDVAILPSMQRQGYGRALLAHCINYAVAKHKYNLNLDVETSNQSALNLYLDLGFSVHNACDYWTISVETLCSLYHLT